MPWLAWNEVEVLGEEKVVGILSTHLRVRGDRVATNQAIVDVWIPTAGGGFLKWEHRNKEGQLLQRIRVQMVEGNRATRSRIDSFDPTAGKLKQVTYFVLESKKLRKRTYLKRRL